MSTPDADLHRDQRDIIDTAPVDAPVQRGTRRRSLLSTRDALQPESVPPPPEPRKRRPGVLAAVSGFLTFLLVGFFVAAFALVGVTRKLHEPGPLTADKVLYIAPGTDVPDIITLLDNEGVIASPLLLNTALLVEGARSKLRAGEYLFKQSASLQEVMDTLVSGRQVLHPVTLPEGLTSDQIVQRLKDNDLLTGDVRDKPKEGTLLPETYKVARGDSRSALVKKMQDDQRRVVDQVWSRRSPDLPIKTPYELVTLASIVERETGRADERPHVASVFINRLNKRMRLQSDPTIVYGLVQGRGTLGRGILRSEVDKWTPYNTYQIDGLPPGPIANPGRAALEAVANPSRTSDLYFVADGTGGHVFASTLDEHSRNVARWRQIERDARDKSAADVDKAPAPNMTVPPAASGAPGASGSPGAPVSRPGQRGDASPSFGTLTRTAAAATTDDLGPHIVPAPPGASRVASDLLGDARSDRTIATILADRGTPSSRIASVDSFTAIAQATDKPSAGVPAIEKSSQDKPAGALAFGPDVEALGFQVRGVQSRSSLLDGAAEGEDGEQLATYPVSPQRRAEQKAAAARFGLPSEADVLPQQSLPDVTVAVPVQRHARAFDASEGTALDPLRNHSWDLSHAQVVPGLTIR